MTGVWTDYRVTWKFLTRLCGQTPSDPAIIKKWLDVRKPENRPAAGGKSIQEIQEEVIESLGQSSDDVAPSVLVFQHDAAGVVMRASTVRAHLKDCARQLSTLYIGKIVGEKSFAVRVVNGVYTDPHEYWIPILRPDGSHIAGADGVQEKPVHVMTRMGPQNSLKAIEFIEPPSQMTFTLKVLGKALGVSDLETLLTYGGVHGYAGERSDGEGRYEWTIKPFDA